MARQADGKGKVRAQVESVILALVVDWEEVEPILRLRIEQAMRRDPRLYEVLDPALDELSRMARGIADAKAQVHAARSELMR